MSARPAAASPAGRLTLLVVASLLAPAARAQVAGENVDMVSGTQWPGGDPYLQRQNEPTLAVSSVNPQHLVAGANDYRSVDVPDPAYGTPIVGDAWLGVFKSLDGGQTWKSVLLPGYPQECSAVALENQERAAAVPPLPPLSSSPLCGYPAAADPVMRAGTDGLFYLAGINFLRDKSRSRIFVARFLDDNDKENGSATGDPALLDPAHPTRFTPTDPIRYLDTVEIWSSERNKAASPGAPTMFMDKPWIAVDVPRSGAACALKTAGGAPILAGAVYVAWTQFYPDDYQSDVMLSWSSDCGATWSKPHKLNGANSTANQGVSLAIEPITGRVYASWRRAAWPAGSSAPKQGDAIMVTRSEGRQRTFAAPRAIAKVIPFDMANGVGRARTQTMPTLAISSDGTSSWAHVAWSGRAAANGEARIFLTTARVHPRPSGDDDADDPEENDDETRIVWSTPALADPTVVSDDVGHVFTHGHQYMPSLTFGQGRLMLLYYDTRLDHTVRYYRPITPVGGRFYEEELGPRGELADGRAGLVFGPEVDDATLTTIRHTIDTRVASLPWGTRTASGGALVSRFPLGIRGDETNPDHLATPPPLPLAAPGFGAGASVVPGKLGIVDATGLLLREQQLQLNVPGFPIFKGGTAAFMGDYVDIQGPAFVPQGGGWWRFNLAPSAAPVFHAVWTSNQDVKKPRDGNWQSYTPVTGLLGGPSLLYDGGRTGPVQTPVLTCDPGSVGSRDQNIYTSRITEGLEVSSPQNVKPLAAGALTSFVVVARNETAAPMSVLLAASSASPVTIPPPASATVDYSFTPLFSPPLTSLCATIAPHGSMSRTLFAQLRGMGLASTPLYVQADEVASCAPGAARTGRSGSLTLNPPVAFTSLVQPDGASLPPLASGEVYVAVTAGSRLSNPNPAPGPWNATVTNPALENPALQNPAASDPFLSNPTLSDPTLGNPTLGNPTLGNPTLGNPTLGNPTLGNPTLGNPTLGNSPPWDESTTVTNGGNTTTSYHVKLVGSVDPGAPLQLILSKTYYTPAAVGCDLKQVAHDEVFVSVPDAQKAIVSPASQVDPGASDPSVANATLSLAPGETGTITLRGYMPLADFARTVGAVQAVSIPASVAPQPGVTYASYQPPAGQPPLLKPSPIVTIAAPPGAIAAQVSPDPAWTSPPPQPITGSVTFVRNGTELLGTAPLDASGRAQLSASLRAGDSVVALYGGDAHHAAASATWLQPAGIAVTIVPTFDPVRHTSAYVSPGGTFVFSAIVTGTSDTRVTWSVQEGPAGGTINAAGAYTAPATPGVYHVQATSLADPTAVNWVLVNTVTDQAPLGTPRAGHAAASIGCTVFALGGTATGNEALSSIEGWNVCMTTSFGTMGDLLSPRFGAAATVAPSADGSKYLVYIAGGRGGGPAVAAPVLASVEAFDWLTGTSVPLSPMNVARQNATAATVTVGGTTYVYVIGGSDAAGSPIATVERLDTTHPAAGWELLPGTLATARELHATAVASAGGVDRVYAIGGRNGAALASVEILDPSTGTWSAGPPLPVALEGAGATGIGLLVYVVGGASTGLTSQPSVWRLEGTSWSGAGAIYPARGSLGVTSVNSEVFAIGGNVGPGWTTTGVAQGFARP